MNTCSHTHFPLSLRQTCSPKTITNHETIYLSETRSVDWTRTRGSVRREQKCHQNTHLHSKRGSHTCFSHQQEHLQLCACLCRHQTVESLQLVGHSVLTKPFDVLSQETHPVTSEVHTRSLRITPHASVKYEARFSDWCVLSMRHMSHTRSAGAKFSCRSQKRRPLHCERFERNASPYAHNRAMYLPRRRMQRPLRCAVDQHVTRSV